MGSCLRSFLGDRRLFAGWKGSGYTWQPQTGTLVLNTLRDAKGVGACRRAASRLCALPPPHFQNRPIPAGLVPAQVSRRVSELSPPGGRGRGQAATVCQYWTLPTAAGVGGGNLEGG